MAHLTHSDRVVSVHGPGALLVVSDLHGNLADLQRMIALWRAEPDACLLLLGDLLHGPEIPPDLWASDYQHLGDHYVDASDALFFELERLIEDHPDRVASLMGNHDHAHVGGPVVAKFFTDEAAHTESKLPVEAIPRLRRFLGRLPLIGTSACGVAFTHASPPHAHFDRALLANLDLRGYEQVPTWEMLRRGFLGEILWRRGSRLEDTQRFLARLAYAFPEQPCQVGVYGHEIARGGFEAENDALLNLSSSFGMRRAEKTYLRLDLTRRYDRVEDLRPGQELLPMYP